VSATRSQVAIAVPPHDGIAEVEQNFIRLQWHISFTLKIMTATSPCGMAEKAV